MIEPRYKRQAGKYSAPLKSHEGLLYQSHATLNGTVNHLVNHHHFLSNPEKAPVIVNIVLLAVRRPLELTAPKWRFYMLKVNSSNFRFVVLSTLKNSLVHRNDLNLH